MTNQVAPPPGGIQVYLQQMTNQWPNLDPDSGAGFGSTQFFKDPDPTLPDKKICIYITTIYHLSISISLFIFRLFSRLWAPTVKFNRSPFNSVSSSYRYMGYILSISPSIYYLSIHLSIIYLFIYLYLSTMYVGHVKKMEELCFYFCFSLRMVETS